MRHHSRIPTPVNSFNRVGPATPPYPSLADLARLEPRLTHLADTAAKCNGTSWREWERIKRQLSSLVGWSTQNPVLSGSTAFDVAYRELLYLFETPPGSLGQRSSVRA